MSAKANPLGYQPIGKLLKNFAVPSVVSMLAMAVYNIVDQIFIGQGVGYLGNAATTVAFPIMTISLSVAILFGGGGAAYAAIRLGEKRLDLAEKALGNIVMLLTLCGFLITVCGLLFLEPLLRTFGATAASMPYAKTYGSIILMGTIFQLWSIALSNMCRTDGSPQFSMYTILLGVVINFILDPIYIFILGWGVAGAAIATVESQLISTVLLLWYFLKKSKHIRLKRSALQLDKAVCKNIIYLGISSFILQVSVALLQVVMNNLLVYYGNLSPVGGDVALSAMGIILKLHMIILAFCVGIGIGAQPILGFNYGARQFKRVKKTYVLAACVASGIAFLGWLICMLFPTQILSLFGDAHTSFNTFAVHAMRVFTAGIFCAGFQVTASAYFQATGQPKKAVILSLSRSVLALIPLILILPLFFGLEGILYAGPSADLIAVSVAGILIFKELKRLKQHIQACPVEPCPEMIGTGQIVL